MTRNAEEFVNHAAASRTPAAQHGEEHVAILLALYNGNQWLDEQLQSLSAQTHRDWSLIISDDGSSDGWMETVQSFARAEGHRSVWMVNGPRRGYAQNFLSLAALAGPTVPFAAYCDQDDVWLPKKLERALEKLRRVPPGEPALYCAGTTVCDDTLSPKGRSPKFDRPPCFENALVQNIGGGNTMVFNRAALDLLQDTYQHATGVVSHDWWTYQLVTGAGGTVIYDQEPTVLYRQHAANLIGSNASSYARLERLKQLMAGRFRAWNSANTAALGRVSHWLKPQATDTLSMFEKARNGTLFGRLLALHQAGLFRQTKKGQMALWLAALFKKL